MIHIPYGEGDTHAAKLKRGLAILGPTYAAQLCWWCNGTTSRKFEHCTVCSKGRGYGFALGLLIGNEPAPDSVVNQVLVAADRESATALGNSLAARQ